MKQLVIKEKVTIRWWRIDGKKIVPEHVQRLDDYASDRILSQKNEGVYTGELVEFIEGISYRGWFNTVHQKNV